MGRKRLSRVYNSAAYMGLKPHDLYNYYLEYVFPDKEKERAFLDILKKEARYEAEVIYRITVDVIAFMTKDTDMMVEYHLSECLDLMARARSLEQWFLVSVLWNAMGTIYQKFGMIERSVECYSRVLELEEKHKFSFMTFVAYFNLATIYSDLKSYKKALDCLTKSIVELEKHPPSKRRYTSKMFYNYTAVLSLYCKLDRLDKAREIYEKLSGFDRSVLGEFYSYMFHSVEFLYKFTLYSNKACDFSECRAAFERTLQYIKKEEGLNYYVGLCNFLKQCHFHNIEIELYQDLIMEVESLYPQNYLAADGVALKSMIKYYEHRGNEERLLKLYREFTVYHDELITQYQENQLHSVDLVETLLINNPEKCDVSVENLELRMLYHEASQAKAALNEAYKRIELINEIGKKLTSSINLNEVIKSINEILRSHVEFDTFTLFMSDKEKAVLRSLIFEYNGSLQPTLEIALSDEGSFNARCYRMKKPFYVDSIKQKNLKRLEVDSPIAMRSAVYLPLIVDEDVIGVYTLQHRGANVYKNKLEFLENITPIISIALNNAIRSWSLEKEIESHIITQNKLKSANLRLEKLSLIDGLTHISSRRFFEKKILEMLEESEEAKSCLTMFMIDIDNFKLYNDSYGHLEGDNALKAVATVFKSAMEEVNGLSARFGGEEFIGACALLSMEESKDLAERIRRAVYELAIENKGASIGRLTVSIGLAYGCGLGVDSKSLLMKTADEMLYEAKNGGKNRSVIKNLINSDIL